MAHRRSIEQFNLRSRLRFSIESGQIWLDENRMLLLHARSLGLLRRELLGALGERRARGLLVRMGFASGQQDADLATKLLDAGDPYDVFRIGPEMHAFEGQVKATILEARIDWAQGSFLGEVEWLGSWEAESQVQCFGIGDSPACWTLVGYASGYVSRFFKRFIVFRETECVARGDRRCLIVGKPADAWGADDGYLDYFREEDADGRLLALADELRALRGAGRTAPAPAGRLVGNSPAFRAAFDLLGKAADSAITVLLLGETGTGKDLFARWLHEHGNRAERPFVAVNCAAIPHDLVEAELFGVQKGAYTGAHSSRLGRFERAEGGTVFLDEIGDLPPAAQVKLLRVLQSGEIERLGDDRTRRVDVRLVAATNVDLQRAIAEGRFRADLYYRLAAYPITIPPLRERSGDIALLASALIDKYATTYRKRIGGLSDRAVQTLAAHAWPGNVRELENLIERGVLLAPDGGLIETEHLFAGAGPPIAEGVSVGREGVVGDPAQAHLDRLVEACLGAGMTLEQHEVRMLRGAVQRANGNLTQAARSLGITRRQLAYRLRRQRSTRR